MKRAHLFWIGTLLVGIPVLFWFYHINTSNYVVYKEIRNNVIQHPEKIPTSDLAKLSSFWFTHMMADMYWLETIQYIGGNVIGGEYKKYLYAMMDLITDLDPHFERPYIIGQLLLPSNEKAYEEFDGEALIGIEQGKELWLKGVHFFCDADMIQKISSEYDLQKIISEEQYRNPCKAYKIPYYLAYIYYYYLQDNENASLYYKVVSAQEDAPQWAKILAAIMQGKAGKREKSLYMFLSLAKSTGSDQESCTLMTQELEKSYNFITQNNFPLIGEFIKNIELLSEQILPVLSEENENEVLDDTKCTNFLTKAIREINLMYLEEADAKYIIDHPGEISAMTPQALFDTGYINFIPTDYQQYKEEGYGIIYIYNPKIGRFDYKMWY